MSFGDDLIDILSLSRCKGREAEVIDDKEIGPEESLHSLLPGMIRSGSMEASEHFNGFDKKHIIAFPACLMTYGLCQVGLPHPGRTVDKDMFLSLNEDTSGQILDQSALDLRVKGEVKSL